VTKPEIAIKREESLPSDDDNLAHDGMSERRYQQGKAEADAKAGATRHLLRYPDNTSERAANTADAKVGQTQHSPVEKLHRSLQHAKNELVNDGNRDEETGQHPRNDRPEGTYTRRPDKTCI